MINLITYSYRERIERYFLRGRAMGSGVCRDKDFDQTLLTSRVLCKLKS